MVGREQLAGAPEAGGDLVEHQQHVVGQAQLAQHVQVARIVEAHPPGPLQHRFDDHGSQLVRVPLDQPGQLGDIGRLEPGRWGGREHLLRQHSRQSACMPPSGSQTLIAANVSPW